MVLLRQRLIDLNSLEPAAIIVHGDGDIDSSAEAALLNGFSNLFLQLCE